MDYVDLIKSALQSCQAEVVAINDRIWSLAEIRYEEQHSSELLAGALERAGFAVTRAAGGIQTAFVASYGSGAPVVAILAEYDALTNLSQKAGALGCEPLVEGGNGHGCGHNLLGSGSLAAALAVKHCIDTLKLPGTIRLYGCPAEEGGGGKAFMVAAGLFEDVDVALTWHPWDENLAYHAVMLATNQLYFTFHGTASHAGFEPHLGRSALDAVELMNVGANFLREHIIQDARVHYAITNPGGRSPNVVHPRAEVLYKVRAPQMDQVREITARIGRIAEGAALMTDTRVEVSFDAASADLVPNLVLTRMMHAEFSHVGVATFSAQEKEQARALQATFPEETRQRIAQRASKALSEDLNAFAETPEFLHASTDVGDVSWVVPTGQVYVATAAYGTPPHSWQMVTQGTSSHAHKGMLQAGMVLAASAVRCLREPELVRAASDELQQRLGGRRYVSLLPPGTRPMRLR